MLVPAKQSYRPSRSAPSEWLWSCADIAGIEDGFKNRQAGGETPGGRFDAVPSSFTTQPHHSRFSQASPSLALIQRQPLQPLRPDG
jgi:hypothetical protein